MTHLYLLASETYTKKSEPKEFAIFLSDPGFDIELKLNRKSFDLLSTPYMKRCQTFSDDTIESRSLYHGNCLLSPFVIEDHKYFHKTCYKSIEANFIKNKTKSCHRNYYEIIQVDHFQDKHGDSRIKIPGNITVDHQYTALRSNGFN